MHQLERIARDAIAACEGRGLTQKAMDAVDLGSGRVHVVGAGKAASSMAAGVVDVIAERGAARKFRGGLVVSKDESRFAPDGVGVIFAGHPEPDASSARAAERIGDYLYFTRADDLVIFVLSGGASSLIAKPQQGLSVAALRQATRAMIKAGLGIDKINCVRKHITQMSGGRLARTCAARVEVLVMSDVLSGDLSSIGSGPFIGDTTTFDEALSIARELADMPAAVLHFLEDARVETPEDVDVPHHVVADHDTLRQAVMWSAREAGIDDVVMHDAVEADVADVAKALMKGSAELVVGSGEPTVALPEEHGLGGRCQQLALMMAREIAGDAPRTFLAIGSDGSDGPTDAAGAIVDNESHNKLGRIDDALAAADAYPVLEEAGCLIKTGATGCNLLDLQLLARPG